ncbi:hypothetical protein HMJ29_10965 [Hymenobacter taeanensis]|uniref:Uncharacterized protein n=1 Tax=Hymenobacter taeanensis TaxID=2735321 RepID=A0A6M6BH93_9BACT|nr:MULTISPECIES: hypothetical protein [Hymenobacter]QJX47429.1 hypothetical protein HMJ29_10965 [Hymenobacter taeanensis]UOQ83089.1 hypothetical protein MUN83_10150 [Hymenobacter sp. 5414T-23]
MYSNNQPAINLTGEMAAQEPEEVLWGIEGPTTEAAHPGKRDKLAVKLVYTASKLQPLVELLDRIQPHLENDSIFSSRREKIKAQVAIVHAQLRSDRPRRQAVVEAFHTMSEFVREESREITRDEAKESAKRFVVATLKNAPSLISAASQAGLLS